MPRGQNGSQQTGHPALPLPRYAALLVAAAPGIADILVGFTIRRLSGRPSVVDDTIRIENVNRIMTVVVWTTQDREGIRHLSRPLPRVFNENVVLPFAAPEELSIVLTLDAASDQPLHDFCKPFRPIQSALPTPAFIHLQSSANHLEMAQAFPGDILFVGPV